MVASALISLATSLKLPLSTTYVTFMVAMGTSFSDQAWGRDSAVYRVSGVLTVIGGWFFTAMMAFTVSAIFAVIIYLRQGLGDPRHRRRGDPASGPHPRPPPQSARKRRTALDVFNLRKITDATAAARTTFEHTGIFLREVRKVLDIASTGSSLSTGRSSKRPARGSENCSGGRTSSPPTSSRCLRLLGRAKRSRH